MHTHATHQQGPQGCVAGPPETVTGKGPKHRPSQPPCHLPASMAATPGWTVPPASSLGSCLSLAPRSVPACTVGSGSHTLAQQASAVRLSVTQSLRYLGRQSRLFLAQPSPHPTRSCAYHSPVRPQNRSYSVHAHHLLHPGGGRCAEGWVPSPAGLYPQGGDRQTWELGIPSDSPYMGTSVPFRYLSEVE